MRKKAGASLASVLLAMVAIVATVAGTGTASAAPDTGRAAFVTEARGAGLSAEQATGLQNKVDAYLAKLDGRGTQISPNQIDLKGAVLNLTVPGEKQIRQLGDVGILAEGIGSTECIGGARYGWFCAYAGQNFSGERLGIYRCGVTWTIPWFSVGSWDNNQTPGTSPLLTFTNGSTWQMPPARSSQTTGVNWAPVLSIRAC
ncbi:peptidase inhibitor family I36 protein [Streptomyces sp. NPDC000878]